jgi:glycolate oxidase iron-sulfur subunit
MQIELADFLRDTPECDEAAAIVQKCVHCGFCTATCPTYQLLGDELDGPRGRIYLMKQVLEGADVTESTRQHLDRCLTCRNCESTCPSGVSYGRLADIGRKLVDERLDAKGIKRPIGQRVVRWLLKEGLSRPTLFTPAMRLGQAVRPLLPQAIRNKVPPRQHAGIRPDRRHARKMILLDGCVQPAMSPNINAATARVLDRLGIELIAAPRASCCGAIRHHMNDHDGGLAQMRGNIDAWWPLVEAGAEAIVITASGCGITIKEYGDLMLTDPEYAAKAARISALARDLSEVLHDCGGELASLLPVQPPVLFEPKDTGASTHLNGEGKVVAGAGYGPRARIAYHPPCTLQHGQKIRGKIEFLLTQLGIEVALCADSHLCCGSAGTYSVLQPDLAYRLRDQKLANLQATKAEAIVSANIGCLTHLQSGTDTPVRHWIELVDQLLHPPGTGGLHSPQ